MLASSLPFSLPAALGPAPTCLPCGVLSTLTLCSSHGQGPSSKPSVSGPTIFLANPSAERSHFPGNTLPPELPSPPPHLQSPSPNAHPGREEAPESGSGGFKLEFQCLLPFYDLRKGASYHCPSISHRQNVGQGLSRALAGVTSGRQHCPAQCLATRILRSPLALRRTRSCTGRGRCTSEVGKSPWPGPVSFRNVMARWPQENATPL